MGRMCAHRTMWTIEWVSKWHIVSHGMYTIHCFWTKAARREVYQCRCTCAFIDMGENQANISRALLRIDVQIAEHISLDIIYSISELCVYGCSHSGLILMNVLRMCCSTLSHCCIRNGLCSTPNNVSHECESKDVCWRQKRGGNENREKKSYTFPLGSYVLKIIRKLSHEPQIRLINYKWKALKKNLTRIIAHFPLHRNGVSIINANGTYYTVRRNVGKFVYRLWNECVIIIVMCANYQPAQNIEGRPDVPIVSVDAQVLASLKFQAHIFTT